MTKSNRKTYQEVLDKSHHNLSQTEKVFSKIIHSSFIGITTKMLEDTVFRPTPLIVALSLSIVSGCILFIFALLFGYTVRSFEGLGFFFLFGFIIGIIYEYLRLLTRSTKK